MRWNPMASFLGALMALTAFPHVSRAQGTCGFVASTPESLGQELFDRAPDLGLAELPADVLPGVVPSGQRVLLRGRDIVATVAYARDDVSDRADLVVFGADGKELAHSSRSYEAGRHNIAFWSVRDPIVRTAPYLSLSAEGAYVEYFRYGAEVPYIIWQGRYADAKSWLFRAVAGTPVIRPLVNLSPYQSLSIAIASDPLVTPYWRNISLIPRGRTVVLAGVVPSTAMVTILVNHVLNAGFGVSNQLVVDTGTRVVDVAPRAYQCWGS